jgi:hypothetical protein
VCSIKIVDVFPLYGPVLGRVPESFIDNVCFTEVYVLVSKQHRAIKRGERAAYNGTEVCPKAIEFAFQGALHLYKHTGTSRLLSAAFSLAQPDLDLGRADWLRQVHLYSPKLHSADERGRAHLSGVIDKAKKNELQ